MKVIVVGAGEVGLHVARTLSAERHEVTIVDADPEHVEAIQGDVDALVVAGNGASPRFLAELNAGDSDLVCAVTRSDEVNIISALSAGQLGAKQTAARVRSDDYFGDDDSMARDLLGIDYVVHPERATAEDMAEAISLPGAVHVEHFADDMVAVAEFVLTVRSPLLGRALRERKVTLPHSVPGLIRNGRVVAAEEGHRPKAGDHLLIAAATEDIGPVLSQLAGEHRRGIREVVIFGGGRIGLPLAERLEAKGVAVTVMEPDIDRARYVAEHLRKATVLHEEGVAKDALLAHGVDQAGAFVAATSDDRANLLAALNAKQVGAALCLAVVSREEFTPLVDALQIDAGFSPRLVTAEAILRSVRGGNVEEMHLMLGGAEVLDVRVDAGCKADGRPLRTGSSMAITRVAAVVRDGEVLFPGEEDPLRGGDRIITFNARRGVSNVVGAFKAQ